MAAPASGWAGRPSPSLDDVERLADIAFAALPARIRVLCDGVVIRVADWPDDATLDELGLDSAYDLLGLFRGIGLAQGGGPAEHETGRMPNMVWLFRRPLLDHWAEHDDTLDELVAHVLVHEIGHHFGLSDGDMETIEASAE